MVSMGNDLKKNTDNVSISLKYKNGSLGVINYFSNGNKSYSKERFEIFYDENSIELELPLSINYSEDLKSRLDLIIGNHNIIIT